MKYLGGVTTDIVAIFGVKSAFILNVEKDEIIITALNHNIFINQKSIIIKNVYSDRIIEKLKNIAEENILDLIIEEI